MIPPERSIQTEVGMSSSAVVDLRNSVKTATEVMRLRVMMSGCLNGDPVLLTKCLVGVVVNFEDC